MPVGVWGVPVGVWGVPVGVRGEVVGFGGVPVGVEGVLDREWARRVGMVGRLLSSLVHSNSFYEWMKFYLGA